MADINQKNIFCTACALLRDFYVSSVSDMVQTGPQKLQIVLAVRRNVILAQEMHDRMLNKLIAGCIDSERVKRAHHVLLDHCLNTNGGLKSIFPR
jgi:hypothetical protein